VAFEFKFEVLKRHRKRLEEIAQRDFVEARHNLDNCLAIIAGHFRAIDETRLLIVSLQKIGSSESLGEILSAEHFISGVKIRIVRERERARELMRIMEEKHELLIEAARAHKMLVKLRDRKFSEYRKERRRDEAKRIDDLVTIRSKRRALT